MQNRSLIFYGACLASMIAAAALKYEPSGYVQDGLVAHFDGIRNAGAGKAHDALATTWVDLSPNQNDAALMHDASDASLWRADGFRFEGGSFFQLAQNITLTDTVTIQVVCNVDTNELNASKRSYPHLVGAGDNDNCNVYYARGYTPYRLVFKNASGGNTGMTDETWEGQYATAIRNGNQKRLFQTGDGSGGATVNGSQSNIGTQTWRIGAAGQQSSRVNNRLVGTIQALRVYNRALTTAELEANRAIDDVRFKTGLPVTNAVVATSVRGVEGTEPSGVYAVDGSHTFTASATVTIGPDTYACAGYTLEAWDDGTGTWGAPVLHGGVLAAEIAESSPKVRLTWQWTHTAGPGALDVGDYASDGLAMLFDGYRNAGRAAPHDPAATAWANLAGIGNNAPLTVNDAESKWLENGYFFGGGTYGQLAVQQYLGSNYTVQIACDVDTREQFAIRAANGKALRWPHLFGAGSSDCCNFYYHLEWNAEGNLNSPLCFKDTAGARPNLFSWNGRYVTSVRDGRAYRSVQGDTLTGGATATAAEEKGAMPVGLQTWYIATAEGGSGKTARYLTGVIHAIRVYGRVLTDEEMAAHLVLDEARFWGRPTTNGMVIVASRVAGLAGNEPNGAYRPAAYAFSAPTGTFTVGDKDYQLDGYVVETWDPYAQSWRTVEQGAGNSWTSPAGTDWASRRLTWKWKVVRGLKTYGTRDYVQEGLVLHLDGIRNKGADRPHDGNMIYSWRDLSWRRGYANIIERMPCESEWLDNGYYFAGSNYVQTAESFSIGSNLTAEVLCEIDNTVQEATYPTYFSGYPNDAFVIFTRNTTGTTLEWKQDEFAGGTRPKATNWKGRNFSATLGDTASTLYEDGAAKVTQARAKIVRFNPTQWRLMDNACDWSGSNKDNPVYNHHAIGTIHTARLYNRPLTAEEVARNHAVDMARYDGMPPVTNVVLAAGKYEASVEKPGVYEVEGAWTFSATNAVVDGKAWQVTGYTLETWSDGAWSTPTAYNGASCTYTAGTSPAKVRLTWLWQRDGTCIIIR